MADADSIVLPLAQAPGAPVAGGKGASLGELVRAQIPVPPGFVVTTGAFAAAMRVNDPGGRLRAGIEASDAADLPALARAAARTRDAIIAGPLPAGTAAAIRDAYASLRDAPVAVRSSATMEDSAAASFAGLQDTYLGVQGTEAVLDAVRRCWASLYNDESVAYRRRMGLPEGSLSMAVVVQLMVAPRSAGVMFTRSPVSGDRSVVAIEGTWGLGSALVAGDVTPDSFVISKITGEITGRRVSAKAVTHALRAVRVVAPPGDVAAAGVAVVDTPAELRERACLSDGEIRALAAVARRVEGHYGSPQDIEWAVLDGDAPEAERVVLLQSRPETVWAARDAAASAPLAAPKARPADHVLSLFAKPQSR
jgi:pyruvate, water dikinase